MLQGETAHGNRVLLESSAELVDADQNATPDLYLYDAGKSAGHRLTLISQGDVPGVDAKLTGSAAASKDLHRVYFITNNQILAGQPDSPGQKLYLWEESGGHSNLTFLATVAGGASLYVSPDGGYLAFSSTGRVTAYDNAGYTEFYRYDAGTGQMACASCNPYGRPATSSASDHTFGEVLAPHNRLRNMSSQGQVFFQTTESLSPHDSNGQQDVYEYEGGVPRLVSSGVGVGASTFLDASEKGDDVFFDTSDSLVGWDFDDNVDAYDARVNGGLPEPTQGVLGCEGDACQAAPNPPDDETPASASFNGVGNLAAPVSKPAVKAKSLTRAQKLSRALKACKRDKSKKRRSACEKKAKKRYGRSK